MPYVSPPLSEVPASRDTLGMVDAAAQQWR
jgi:hypothetical protein